MKAVSKERLPLPQEIHSAMPREWLSRYESEIAQVARETGTPADKVFARLEEWILSGYSPMWFHVNLEQDDFARFGQISKLVARVREDDDEYEAAQKKRARRSPAKSSVRLRVRDDSTLGKRPARVAGAKELAERIDAAADGIAALRINSAHTYVEQLRRLSVDLRSAVPEAAKKEMKRAVTRSLPILANFYETMGSKVAAQALVAGAVAGIVALGGWPTVTVYALTMAAWQGKEAFAKAVAQAFPKRNSN